MQGYQNLKFVNAVQLGQMRCLLRMFSRCHLYRFLSLDYYRDLISELTLNHLHDSMVNTRDESTDVETAQLGEHSSPPPTLVAQCEIVRAGHDILVAQCEIGWWEPSDTYNVVYRKSNFTINILFCEEKPHMF
jgi:hypothetical protein